MEAKRLEEEAAAEAERLRLEQEEADRLAAEAAAAAEAEAKASKKGRKKAQVNGHPNPAVDGLISDSRRGSYDGSRRGSSGSVILGEKHTTVILDCTTISLRMVTFFNTSLLKPQKLYFSQKKPPMSQRSEKIWLGNFFFMVFFQIVLQ